MIQLKAAADPLAPIDETHPAGGVAVELADAALRTQGYAVRNRIMPWARAWRRHELDATISFWTRGGLKKGVCLFVYSMPC